MSGSTRRWQSICHSYGQEYRHRDGLVGSHSRPGRAQRAPPAGRLPRWCNGPAAAGEIAQTGAGVRDWRVGERVTFDSIIYCGQCFYCARGERNLCENRQVLGVSPGPFGSETSGGIRNVRIQHCKFTHVQTCRRRLRLGSAGGLTDFKEIAQFRLTRLSDAFLVGGPVAISMSAARGRPRVAEPPAKTRQVPVSMRCRPGHLLQNQPETRPRR